MGVLESDDEVALGRNGVGLLSVGSKVVIAPENFWLG